MDHGFIDRMRKVLNADVARRLMIKYFIGKGFNNFDTLLYPGSIQDMPFVIPEMADKIEIIPHSNNIDPIQDKAELGWNLFVLGTQRCYLGETYHHGLKTLAMQIQQGRVMSEDLMATRQTTPRRIIQFVSRVLETHKAGYLDLAARTMPMDLQNRGLGSGMAATGQQFGRSGYGT
jgi:hypothetical protein